MELLQAFFNNGWALLSSVKVPSFDFSFAMFYAAIAFSYVLIYFFRNLFGMSMTLSGTVSRVAGTGKAASEAYARAKAAKHSAKLKSAEHSASQG